MAVMPIWTSVASDEGQKLLQEPFCDLGSADTIDHVYRLSIIS